MAGWRGIIEEYRPYLPVDDGAPVVTLLKELERRPGLTSVEVQTDTERVVWRRG